MSAKGPETATTELEARAVVMLQTERALFESRRPLAAAVHAAAGPGFFDGVPQHWMLDWPTPFPPVIEAATGVTLTDIDGNSVIDLCLGDTGAMFGHGPEPVLRALAGAGTHGLTTMLPSSDAPAVGRLLAERFGLPRWQLAATASDANRFAIRIARAVTGRARLLVFDGCYHGAVDDTLVDLVDGRTVSRRNLLGQVRDPGDLTVSIPFNDEDALAAALAKGDVACVLAEPVMTNCGMILPDPGFHATLRRLTREAGALLLIDETHTISSGPGGYTRLHGLEPDLMVMGKPIGGGIPVSVWGMTEAVSDRLRAVRSRQSGHGHSGIGTTLSGSAIQLACLRACLEEVMTDEAYRLMNARADRIEAGFKAAIAENGLGWTVSRVGARLEIVFSPRPVRNAREAREAASDTLEQALHLSMLNLGYLLTPFHNMVLVSPALSTGQADGLVDVFGTVLARMTGREGA
ncbi:aspartate aminotransferase family protein [Rhizobium sp. TRM96647]|uniref:aspartate aminotransferase family protein n=1 Tax=unclassified Rhizobium TaxID=2613769 RepID=UPI0021E7E404|nr:MULTISPECIES: aspartate aminotransferase family protein [unclassified Rhizobium]MCV3739022.1 aspartate aminotransferase family protein [Rhizobium sp. TRM96647]MCV3760579.1 aspartate aminotransferase family protein [Rhizobium sp. TRM96650]